MDNRVSYCNPIKQESATKMMKLKSGEGDSKAMEQAARRSNIESALIFSVTVVGLKAGTGYTVFIRQSLYSIYY